jgi:predicted PurR-regulated permease PerM
VHGRQHSQRIDPFCCPWPAYENVFCGTIASKLGLVCRWSRGGKFPPGCRTIEPQRPPLGFFFGPRSDEPAPVPTTSIGKLFAASAGTGAVKFFIAIIVAGFLYSPAPSLVVVIRKFSHRLASERGEEFVQLAGATIRAVSRGVIGISALQAFFAGAGLVVAGIPGAGLTASAVLILGIIQIGPSIVLIPLTIWSWTAMETTTALLFTAYMIPVSLMDNALRPLLMGRGLQTPALVILIGVIGGTISFGITGLFLGPIILAVIWELPMVWVREQENA